MIGTWHRSGVRTCTESLSDAEHLLCYEEGQSKTNQTNRGECMDLDPPQRTLVLPFYRSQFPLTSPSDLSVVPDFVFAPSPHPVGTHSHRQLPTPVQPLQRMPIPKTYING